MRPEHVALAALDLQPLAADLSRCRHQIPDECLAAAFLGTCQALLAHACLEVLAVALTDVATRVTASLAEGNASALEAFAAQFTALARSLGAGNLWSAGDAEGGGGEVALVPWWPGLLRFLLARPALLEVLDVLHGVAQQLPPEGGLQPYAGLGCGGQAWESLLRSALAWRRGRRWPPVVAPAEAYATEGERELAEWGAAAGSVSCRTSVKHHAMSFSLQVPNLEAGESCPEGILTAHVFHLIPYIPRDPHAAQSALLRSIESQLLSVPLGGLLRTPWPVWGLLRYAASWSSADPLDLDSKAAAALAARHALSLGGTSSTPVGSRSMGACNRTLMTGAGQQHLEVLQLVLRSWAQALQGAQCHLDVTVLSESRAVLGKCRQSGAELGLPLRCRPARGGLRAAKYSALLLALRSGAGAVLWLGLQTALLRDPFDALLQSLPEGGSMVACPFRNSAVFSPDLIFARPGAEVVLAWLLGALVAEPLRREADLLTQARPFAPAACGAELATTDAWRRPAAGGDLPALVGRAPWSAFEDMHGAGRQGFLEFLERSRVEPQAVLEAVSPRLLAVSYAHRCCRRSQLRNRRSALAAGAPRAFALGYEQLLLGTDFERRHSEVLAASRGAGWWLWKPLAVRWALERANPGDVVAYLDAGNRFMPNISLPAEAAQILARSDVAARRAGCCLERHYTSRCVLRRLGLLGSSDVVDTEQVTATFVLLRKTPLASRFVEEWLALAEDPVLLTASCSRAGPGGRREAEYPGFCEHMADQSMFSALFKRYGFEAFSDAAGNRLISYDRDLY